jgi:hypothetical protein
LVDGERLQVYDRILAAKTIADILDAGDPCSCCHYIAHGKWCSCTLAALTVREKLPIPKCWKPPPDETVEEAMIAVFGASKEAPVYNPVATQGLKTSDLHEASKATIGKAGAGRPRKARIPSKGTHGRARVQYQCDRCGKKGHNSRQCTGTKAVRPLSKARQAKVDAKQEQTRLASQVTDRFRAAARASFVVDTHSNTLKQNIRDLQLTEEETACAYRAVIVAIKNLLTDTPAATEGTPDQARIDDLEFQLTIVSEYERELGAAKKCRRAQVTEEPGVATNAIKEETEAIGVDEAGVAIKATKEQTEEAGVAVKAIKEEVAETRDEVVATAVSRMRTIFALLSDSTRKYLKTCTPESPCDGATDGATDDEQRVCFICLADAEEDEDPMSALVCGQCSRPGMDPKWIHNKCMEVYVTGKLAAGVSMGKMTCPLCRSKTTSIAMERVGASGFLGPRTNVSFRFFAANTLHSEFAICCCIL